MKYTVELSEETQIEFDVAPGSPDLTRVEFEFVVMADELEGALEQLGGRPSFALIGEHVFSRQRAPLRRDGEQFGSARVKVWSVERPASSGKGS